MRIRPALKIGTVATGVKFQSRAAPVNRPVSALLCAYATCRETQEPAEPLESNPEEENSNAEA